MKKFFAGMLTMLLILCLGGSVLATTGKVQQEIEYRNIQVSLNGKILDLKDAKGNTVEPFMFAGTNYIPARALAEALGLSTSPGTAKMPPWCWQSPLSARLPTSPALAASTTAILTATAARTGRSPAPPPSAWASSPATSASGEPWARDSAKASSWAPFG